MDSIREQMALTSEISDAISNPVGMGTDLDEDELKNELDELEQDELNQRLAGAEAVPAHNPPAATPAAANAANATAQPQAGSSASATQDEDAELRALQAELAM